MDSGGQNYMEKWYSFTFYAYWFESYIFLCFQYANYMLVSYYTNKKSSPGLLLWQPSLIFFNIPIESGSVTKPCTLNLFQVTCKLHKAGYWTNSGGSICMRGIRYHDLSTVCSFTNFAGTWEDIVWDCIWAPLTFTFMSVEELIKYQMSLITLPLHKGRVLICDICWKTPHWIGCDSVWLCCRSFPCSFSCS